MVRLPDGDLNLGIGGERAAWRGRMKRSFPSRPSWEAGSQRSTWFGVSARWWRAAEFLSPPLPSSPPTTPTPSGKTVKGRRRGGIEEGTQ